MPPDPRELQEIWALVPAPARAGYLRRTAQALLDEVESLADLLARETGRPRTEALLAELLPTVGGLHALADDGPAWLADRRLGRVPVLRAGRRSVLVRAPLGIVGVRGTDASPWLEPALEVAAALLAGNGAVLAPTAPEAATRMRAAFERGGIPPGLIRLAEPSPGVLEEACDAVLPGFEAGRKGTMLVLSGAPLDRVVSGALWAAYAGAGRGPAAVGRVVVVHSGTARLLERLEAGARRLVVGDPARAETEVGPLASLDDLATVRDQIADAVAGGARLHCGGETVVPGADGAFFAPALLSEVPSGARVLAERVPGPVLAIVEADDDDAAIAVAAAERAATVSVWSGDRDVGERIARALPADATWVNEHGVNSPGAEIRLGRHVDVRQLASQPSRLRSARWLPYDPSLVAASTAAARLVHGRETERLAVLRSAARPLARTAGRLAREWTR